MSKEIEVVLVKDVKGLGAFGQTKRVRLGYARNYLLPYEFAILSTPANQNRFKSMQKREEKRVQLELETSNKLAKSLVGVAIDISAIAHDDGTLYGSVSAADIAAKLKQTKDIELDRHYIDLPENIKMTGSYTIPVTLPQGVIASIPLTVSSEVKEVKTKKLK